MHPWMLVTRVTEFEYYFACTRKGVHLYSVHLYERQETPQDPVPAETVSCSWTRDPTKAVWHSMSEVELCPGALLCNSANTDAGYLRIEIANATQFAVR